MRETPVAVRAKQLLDALPMAISSAVHASERASAMVPMQSNGMGRYDIAPPPYTATAPKGHYQNPSSVGAGDLSHRGPSGHRPVAHESSYALNGVDVHAVGSSAPSHPANTGRWAPTNTTVNLALADGGRGPRTTAAAAAAATTVGEEYVMADSPPPNYANARKAPGRHAAGDVADRPRPGLPPVLDDSAVLLCDLSDVQLTPTSRSGIDRLEREAAAVDVASTAAGRSRFGPNHRGAPRVRSARGGRPAATAATAALSSRSHTGQPLRSVASVDAGDAGGRAGHPTAFHNTSAASGSGALRPPPPNSASTPSTLRATKPLSRASLARLSRRAEARSASAGPALRSSSASRPLFSGTGTAAAAAPLNASTASRGTTAVFAPSALGSSTTPATRAAPAGLNSSTATAPAAGRGGALGPASLRKLIASMMRASPTPTGSDDHNLSQSQTSQSQSVAQPTLRPRASLSPRMDGTTRSSGVSVSETTRDSQPHSTPLRGSVTVAAASESPTRQVGGVANTKPPPRSASAKSKVPLSSTTARAATAARTSSKDRRLSARPAPPLRSPPSGSNPSHNASSASVTAPGAARHTGGGLPLRPETSPLRSATERAAWRSSSVHRVDTAMSPIGSPSFGYDRSLDDASAEPDASLGDAAAAAEYVDCATSPIPIRPEYQPRGSGPHSSSSSAKVGAPSNNNNNNNNRSSPRRTSAMPPVRTAARSPSPPRSLPRNRHLDHTAPLFSTAGPPMTSPAPAPPLSPLRVSDAEAALDGIRRAMDARTAAPQAVSAADIDIFAARVRRVVADLAIRSTHHAASDQLRSTLPGASDQSVASLYAAYRRAAASAEGSPLSHLPPAQP